MGFSSSRESSSTKTTRSKRQASKPQVETALHAADRARFLSKSNANLRRIVKTSLMVLAVFSALSFIFSKFVGVSLLTGGILGLMHYKSLHRLFQKKVIDPKNRLGAQFVYSAVLFFLLGFFFWMLDKEQVSTAGLVSGFLLMTASVMFESTRR